MRYALYYVPRHGGRFNEAGARWLGRDAYDGQRYQQPSVDGLSGERVAELTTNARRYGFHATLKAPAPLAAECREADYVAAVGAFCKEMAPVTLPKLTLGSIGMSGTLFALVPETPHAPMNTLERSIVTHFEPWRGASRVVAHEKKRHFKLTERQIEMQQRWGYAFAVDEFRFHITLTDRIPAENVEAVRAAITEHFAEFLAAPLAVDRLGILVEDSPGAPFRVLESFALEGTP